MDQLELNSDSDFELNTYNNELLEDTILYNLNDKLTDKTKPNLLTGDGFCKYFCGTDCKYCKPMSKFPPEKMAVEGLYSTWITNSILAMARPSNEYIEKYDLINQFLKLDIKTIVNMQMNGEHSYCGYPLDPSGFSYDPNKFMTNGIDHFNFPCDDYGTLPISYLFDIMKTLQHRLTVGKIAIHCHAGHGRTGMVIACYLTLNNRISGVQAINYVRKKRSGSIQNKLQVDTILNFAKNLETLRTVFWIKCETKPKFSLQEAVRRQKKLVHGKEAYILDYVPKIIFLCLKSLSKIDQDSENESLFDFSDEKSSNETFSIPLTSQTHKENFVMRQHLIRWIKRIKMCFKKPFTRKCAKSILACFKTTYADVEKLNQIKENLNKTDDIWKHLYEMKDIHLHCQLIIDWLDSLKFPVLRYPDIENMVIGDDEDIIDMFLKLETSVGRTLALFLEFVDLFQNLDESEMWELNTIIFSILTHKNVRFIETDFLNTDFPFELKPHLVSIIKNVISMRISQINK